MTADFVACLDRLSLNGDQEGFDIFAGESWHY